MGETLDTKKIRLVQHITAVQDEAFLDFLEKLFERTKGIGNDNWLNRLKPVRERQTFEDMAREQNYKGFDRKEFDRIIDELDAADVEGLLPKLVSTPTQSERLTQLIGAMEEKTDLQKILREQNYQKPNKQRFEHLIKELNIEEPIEDLLALLSK